jgi:demethoxyubiquinone hydroxylase (CLK1/Coq7/Cat5 family)
MKRISSARHPERRGFRAPSRPMILLPLWLAVSLGFGAFWALTGSFLSLADAPDMDVAEEVGALEPEGQAA